MAILNKLRETPHKNARGSFAIRYPESMIAGSVTYRNTRLSGFPTGKN